MLASAIFDNRCWRCCRALRRSVFPRLLAAREERGEARRLAPERGPASLAAYVRAAAARGGEFDLAVALSITSAILFGAAVVAALARDALGEFTRELVGSCERTAAGAAELCIADPPVRALTETRSSNTKHSPCQRLSFGGHLF